MPVYLCQPGSGHNEPWRHGIQVYAAPFAIDSNKKNDNSNEQQGADSDLVVGLAAEASGGQPIRRVRHAEVLIVDDVCISFDRYWLRLRWPGKKGDFAGYIAMGLVTEYPASGPGTCFFKKY